MDMDPNPIVVEFPLRGEWVALHTPADRVPSHGTDAFGQRYAFDFCRFAPKWDLPYNSRMVVRHLFAFARAEHFLCWNQPVYSAFEGEVISTGDLWPDRSRVNLPVELIRATLFPPGTGSDFRPLLGNFAVVRGDRCVALYAHLRNGSVRVTKGETVVAGQVIGSVGNSGNSTMPHLHFQLMNDIDLHGASGVPCAFRRYERLSQDGWDVVSDEVPGLFERIRA